MLYNLLEVSALIATFASIWPAVHKLRKTPHNSKSLDSASYSIPATFISLLGIIAWLGWSIATSEWIMVMAALSVIIGEMYILKLLLTTKKFNLSLLLSFSASFFFLHIHSEILISSLLILSVFLHLITAKKSSSSHSPLRWLLESSEELLWAGTFLLSGDVILALPALLHIPLALLLAYKSSKLAINFFNNFNVISYPYLLLRKISSYQFFLKNYYPEIIFYKLSPEGNG